MNQVTTKKSSRSTHFIVFNLDPSHSSRSRQSTVPQTIPVTWIPLMINSRLLSNNRRCKVESSIRIAIHIRLYYDTKSISSRSLPTATTCFSGYIQTIFLPFRSLSKRLAPRQFQITPFLFNLSHIPPNHNIRSDPPISYRHILTHPMTISCSLLYYLLLQMNSEWIN